MMHQPRTYWTAGRSNWLRLSTRLLSLLSLLTALVLVACTDGASDGSDGVTGTVEVLVIHYDDGTAKTQYYLYQQGLSDQGTGTDEEKSELLFDGEPPLATGDEIRVLGEESDGAIDVDSYEFLGDDDDVGRKAQALTGNGVRTRSRLAVFLVHWSSPNSLSPSEMHSRVFTGSDSTKVFYDENAYNLVDLEGDVLGWYQIPDPGGCEYGDIARDARAAAEAEGVDLSQYDQFLFYFPRTSACGWSGLGQVGRPRNPASNTWYNGSSGCVVLAHELGHNFGMRHSRSYSCSHNGLPAPLSSAANCDYNEYGDRYDVMGGGCYHTNAYQKASQGWWGGCNGVTTTKNGTFDIVPTEIASDDIQTLRIPMSSSLCPSSLSSCYYYIEYRQPVGEFSDPSSVHDGVLIHVAADADFDGFSRSQSPYLLDMDPSSSTFSDADLDEGDVYEDPAGVRIELLSVDSNRAQVRVTMPGGDSGVARCIDGSLPPGEEPPPQGNCADGQFEFEDHCYTLSSSAFTYDEALATCENQGAGWGLAEIGSAGENNFIASLIGAGEFWLGGNDRGNEGTFSWESGTTFWSGGLGGGSVEGRYANFISDEPNDAGGDSDCVRMIGGGGWRDIQCSNTYRAICESDIGGDEPSCTDGVQNGNETDVDCGGSCGGCSDGGSCSVDGDCQSGNCDGGVCTTVPSCTDGVQNGDETDVDCGGSCSGCADGGSCSVDADCQSSNCDAGTCTSSDPPPPGEVTVDIGITNEWESGYCTDITITNGGSEPTSTWTMSIDLNQATLGSFWNAQLTQSDGVLTATPISWNASISPGQTMSVWGYCADKTGSNWQPSVVSFSAE